MKLEDAQSILEHRYVSPDPLQYRSVIIDALIKEARSQRDMCLDGGAVGQATEMENIATWLEVAKKYGK